MPQIIREDGERFIIPSYRDTLFAKRKNLLKKEILLLSTNHGEYISLQQKNISQYEVAFSPDAGYLLGETVWHYFKRPQDLVYCERIPDTSEAILVIVKSGSVYLDGSFPIDAIYEELIVFKTQQNSFDIYLYGDVPISATPESGKFCFDTSSVKSFTVLDKPALANLPTLKIFQLQLVDSVLQARGIGTLPIKELSITIVIIGLCWMGWTYLKTHKKELPITVASVVNPYQNYLNALTSPDPRREMKQIFYAIHWLYTIPGWYPEKINYQSNTLRASVKSRGMKTTLLSDWAIRNRAQLEVLPEGFFVTWRFVFLDRTPPNFIRPLKQTITTLIDNLSAVLPGNHLQMSAFIDRRSYLETMFTVSFSNVTPDIFDLIAQQFENLPLVLSSVTMQMNNGNLSGTIVLQALGN